MNKDWLELESDPGLFTLLVEDFGVEGVQVEEIYDLQKKIEGPVYGFIFLFKWIEERRSRRKLTQVEDLFVTDEKILNNMFFAQQIVPNSCATHSLLSVLLNCENIKLGETLTKLKDFSKNMSPEDKGLTISNMPQLASAHNSHARPDPGLLPDQKSQGIPGRTMEAFHFASYVPLNGRLFEMDGLKPYPIDHGPWSSGEDWTDKFHHVITERLGMSTGSEYDIRFNLMAVVPDRRLIYNQKLKTLKTNRQIVLETLQKLLDEKMVDVPETSTTDTVVTISTKSTLTKTSQSKPVLSPPKTRQKTKVAMATGQSPAEPATPSRPQTPPPAQPVSSPPSTASGSLDRSSTQSPVVHAAYALDSHNYAKSPILEIPSDSGTSVRPQDADNDEETDSDVEIIEIDDKITVSDQSPSSKVNAENMKGADFQDSSLCAKDFEALGKTAEVTPSVDLSKLEQSNLKTDASLKICITVKDELNSHIIPSTVALTDVTRPLSIQTKFVVASSGPNSSGTDTASEMGSNLSSPVVRPSTLALHSPGQLAQAVQKVKVEETGQRLCPDEPGTKSPRTRAKHAAFTPKDLLQLLKNVEEEITVCEQHVEEEHAKRKKYKIDDCRRTHNYDEFICTFLTMLAEQGQLGGLVQQHMVVKRRQGVNVGKLHKNKNNNNRKKAKSKKKR